MSQTKIFSIFLTLTSFGIYVVPLFFWFFGGDPFLFVGYIYLGVSYAIFSLILYNNYDKKNIAEITVQQLEKEIKLNVGSAEFSQDRLSKLRDKLSTISQTYHESTKMTLLIQALMAILFALSFLKEFIIGLFHTGR